jgi:hypothetical protein
MIDDWRRYKEIERPVRAILQSFTYKPGWKFSVMEGHLVINFKAVDTDNTENLIPISFVQGIPTLVRDDYPWDRWLLDMIMEVERHEAQEFFKINGVKVFDPHG